MENSLLKQNIEKELQKRLLSLDLSQGNKTSTQAVMQEQSGKFPSLNPLALGKTILQETAKSGGSVGLTLATPFTGGKEITSENLSGISQKVKNFIFGDEPVKPIQQRIAETNLSLKEQGLPIVGGKSIVGGKLSLPLSVLGVGAVIAMDFTGAGGEKNAIKALTIANKSDDVARILKSVNVADDLIASYAPKIAKLSKADDVAKAVDRISELQKTTKKVITETSKIPSVKKQLINTNYLDVASKEKKIIQETIEKIKPQLAEIKGKPLSHKEVLEAAKTSEVLRGASSREATLAREASMLKARQAIAALAEGKGLNREFVETLRKVSQEATAWGRQLESLKNIASPALEASKTTIVKKLLKDGFDIDEIVKAAEGVDFNNLKEVSKFYRQFVKPSLTEIIDEYRYINLLSSPKTHIVNAFSNLLQGTLLSPTTKLVSGSLDAIGSKLTGNARKIWVSEVPAYYKGFFNSIGDATKQFLEVMKGNQIVARPDIKQIPTGVKMLKPLQAVPRLLEGSDVFFRTLIKGGEKEALAVKFLKEGKELGDVALREIADIASKNAEYYVFRQALDATNKTGQGVVLSTIDKFTNAVYGLRRLPGVKWFIPFVQTPMNILKQGIEFSPLGITTLAGATDKTTQLAKAIIGSTVMTGAGWIALQGNSTWSAPTSEKEKEEFYASGRQPYAVKIGNTWVSYTKLGPLAYPLAMASAIQWYAKENPKSISDTSLEKASKIFSSIAQFFSDQSYMQGMNNLLQVASGGTSELKSAVANIPSQLIPLSSLQRWITQIIDPIYRKPASGFSLKSITDKIATGIPFASKNVAPYTNPFGMPSQRQAPIYQAFSPANFGTVQPNFEALLQATRQQQKMKYLKEDLKSKIKEEIQKRLQNVQ